MELINCACKEECRNCIQSFDNDITTRDCNMLFVKVAQVRKRFYPIEKAQQKLAMLKQSQIKCTCGNIFNANPVATERRCISCNATWIKNNGKWEQQKSIGKDQLTIGDLQIRRRGRK